MRNKKMVFGTIILLFALIGICNTLNVSAIEDPEYTYTISPGTAIEFEITASAGYGIIIEFEVTSGGDKDINFYIRDSDGNLVLNWGIVEGYQLCFFELPHAGYYRIIFSNTHSIFTSKVIEINIDFIYIENDINVITPTSYIYMYVATLEQKDWLWIDIDSNDIIDVYIMNDNQFNDLQNSGGLIWNYYRRWSDIISLHESFTITDDGSYYIILHNKDVLYGRIVETNIEHHYDYGTNDHDNYLLGWLVIILPAIVIIIVAIVVRKIYKRKTPTEYIKPEKIPKITHCSNCGTEILDEQKMFCPMCGKEQK